MASFLFEKCRYQRFALAETGAISENAFARDASLRIDHFLLSPSLASRLTQAGVDNGVRGWDKLSDHAPVWIDLAATTKPAATSRRAASVGDRK